jgi:hypothetical protein
MLPLRPGRHEDGWLPVHFTSVHQGRDDEVLWTNPARAEQPLFRTMRDR